MSTPTTSTTVIPPTTKTISSDKAVATIMQQGLQQVVTFTTVGLVTGWLAGIVLARRGGSAGARNVLGGLGGGIGLGSAWTRTSMTLEDLMTYVNDNYYNESVTETKK